MVSRLVNAGQIPEVGILAERKGAIGAALQQPIAGNDDDVIRPDFGTKLMPVRTDEVAGKMRLHKLACSIANFGQALAIALSCRYLTDDAGLGFSYHGGDISFRSFGSRRATSQKSAGFSFW